MSQPPQQPGPYGGQQPGWGQQPGPGQQPGGYPQQGGYPQSGGFPQQGGYPQSGPQPQQQPGGYGQYGQPGQYGQQGQYGQPGAYDPQGFGKKKSPLPWILAGGGVVVIAVVVVLILVLTGDSNTSSPRAAAETLVTAINNRDVNAAKEVDCNKSGNMGEFDLTDKDIPADLKAEITGEATENGDSATVPIKMSALGQSIEGKVELQKKDGAWCVSGFAR